MDLVPAGHPIDGISFLCLLDDPTGAMCTHYTPGENVTADISAGVVSIKTNGSNATKSKVLARFARACSFFQVQQRAGVAAHARFLAHSS